MGHSNITEDHINVCLAAWKYESKALTDSGYCDSLTLAATALQGFMHVNDLLLTGHLNDKLRGDGIFRTHFL